MTEAGIVEKYIKSANRLILLDYDGTLVNYAPKPDKAIPPAELLQILESLIKKPNTKVFIISGRGYNDLDKLLGHISINLIAEHGAMIKKNGKWEKTAVVNGFWKSTLLPTFNRMALSCPQSFVEEKHFSLSWHYRNAEPEVGYAHSRELIRAIRDITNTYRLKVIDGNKIVEVISSVSGKDIAIKNIIGKNTFDCILALGDDKTDEDMFSELAENKNAVTIKIGEGATVAKYRYTSVQQAIMLLKQIAQCD
ncbi:MAG: trehalose-phosphatase [Chitinophagales bacterium]|nr:trehalose-phosphatase [Chitinophagales bacterium]